MNEKKNLHTAHDHQENYIRLAHLVRLARLACLEPEVVRILN
jgi:hypothetical protein